MSLGHSAFAPDGDEVRPQSNNSDVVLIWFEACKITIVKISMTQLFFADSKLLWILAHCSLS